MNEDPLEESRTLQSMQEPEEEEEELEDDDEEYNPI